MSTKILLHSKTSKRASNENNSLTIHLKSSKRLLPIEPKSTVINEMELYNAERKASNLLRLNFSINTIATNACFNNITEIVKNEGSDDVECLNYETSIEGNLELTGKTVFTADFGTTTDASLDDKSKLRVWCTRDTQLSSSGNGYTFHCGTDIYNNHILRSLTFKAIGCGAELIKDENGKVINVGEIPTSAGTVFNTIADNMRNYDNNQISGYSDYLMEDFRRPTLKYHVYLNEEIQSFKESVIKNRTEENGWLGFINSGKFPMFSGTQQTQFNQVINSRKSCDFIDMYPHRDLFNFTPIYNPYRQRVEKNWNYCLTYPSSSTTEDICFINTNEYNGKPLNSLKTIYFDDTVKSSNGKECIKVYSISKHGLEEGNYVNLYKTNASGETEQVMENAEVIEVENDYNFYVFRDGVKVSEKWYRLTSADTLAKKFTYEDIEYKVSDNGKYVSADNKRYFIVNHEKINFDDDAQELSYKRIVSDHECDYYVRIFSRLPNWRFANRIPSEHELYRKDSKLIKEYQTIENEFENHVGQLGFARNIYNDKIAEITFTDDVDISYLKDNLGRPLTDIYLTIIKNNAGYREWYGKNMTENIWAIHRTDRNRENIEQLETIEYSHCFGKNSCSFRFSNESLADTSLNNVIKINNIDTSNDTNNFRGLNINLINDRFENGADETIEEDEIEYNEVYENGNRYDDCIYSGDVNFYGDLCCYCDYLCDEQSIQMVENRFNTAQRELNETYKSFEHFNSLYYDEIISDDFDNSTGGFKLELNKIGKERDVYVNQRKEGYCYYPHYRVPIKTFAEKLSTAYPIFYSMKSFTNIGNGEYEVLTLEPNAVTMHKTLNVYDKTTKERYIATVSEVCNLRKFKVKLTDTEGEQVNIDCSSKSNFKLFYRDEEEIPSYAIFVKDGSCRFYWREVVQNGFDSEELVEHYPFTNGRLYINKNINLFVKRQDPNNYSGIQSMVFPYDVPANTLKTEDKDIYYNEINVRC